MPKKAKITFLITHIIARNSCKILDKQEIIAYNIEKSKKKLHCAKGIREVKSLMVNGEEVQIELGEKGAQFFPGFGRIVKTMLAQITPKRFQTLAITSNGTWLDEYTTMEEAVASLQAWYDTYGV